MDVGQLSKMNFGTLVEILTNEGLKKVQRNTFEFKVNYFKASKIVGCKLELQALMNFDFYLGASCTVHATLSNNRAIRARWCSFASIESIDKNATRESSSLF